MENTQGKQYWPLVISGASGAGKGTVIHNLLKDYPELFELSVSLTTRQPRVGEVDGKDYQFVTKEVFEKDIQEGVFAEYCVVHGNYYGTSKKRLQSSIDNNKICILDIDVQGAKKINNVLKANYIWLDVPSLEELEKRLLGRGTDSQEVITKRVNNAKEQIKQAHECTFYHFITNDVWATTWEKVKAHLATCYPDVKF